MQETPNKDIWAVQKKNPYKYINRNIKKETFIVTNHPLTNSKVIITAFLFNGKIIGGTSFPYSEKNDLVGALYSIEGKTAEEIDGER
ncbi:hypothetical protein [Rossellomorea aquimaris]|uniref:hypothetical protein n=1 Tax=Rossellomorea aquimaris TaxID=189382 RepID=UPI0007D08AC1|nr:hypothetical protein [Rossellomorea aquimaris]